jgi:hypothetical protein
LGWCQEWQALPGIKAAGLPGLARSLAVANCFLLSTWTTTKRACEINLEILVLSEHSKPTVPNSNPPPRHLPPAPSPTMTSEADPKIHLTRIAHVSYTHRDIDAARRFADDFGFSETARTDTRTYYRGYGTEPFVLCLEAGAEDKFGAPGGGKAVTFWDPVDGFPFHLVWGQERVPLREPSFPTLKVNYVSCGT